MPHVTAISGSPKKSGNTEKLLDSFLKGCENSNWTYEKVLLRKLKFRSCIACNKCHETGVCVLKDDLTPILDKVSESNILVLASPIYSMTVTSEMKAFIDRGQYLWAKKFKTHEVDYDEKHLKTHIGVFVSTAGMDLETVFDHAFPTVRAFFNDAGFTYSQNILANAMDKYNTIEGRPDLMKQAEIQGQELTESISNIQAKFL